MFFFSGIFFPTWLVYCVYLCVFAWLYGSIMHVNTHTMGLPTSFTRF